MADSGRNRIDGVLTLYVHTVAGALCASDLQVYTDGPVLTVNTGRLKRSSNVAWALRGFWLPVGVLRI